MKFYCHRTPTIMDGLVLRWNPAGNLDAEISASRNGVAISGYWDFRSPTMIASFRLILAYAEEARLALGQDKTPARYENEIDVKFGDTLEDVVARHEQAAKESAT